MTCHYAPVEDEQLAKLENTHNCNLEKEETTYVKWWISVRKKAQSHVFGLIFTFLKTPLNLFNFCLLNTSDIKLVMKSTPAK